MAFTDIISYSDLSENSICTLFGIDIYYHLHGTWWPEFYVLALPFHCNGEVRTNITAFFNTLGEMTEANFQI